MEWGGHFFTVLCLHSHFFCSLFVILLPELNPKDCLLCVAAEAEFGSLFVGMSSLKSCKRA